MSTEEYKNKTIKIVTESDKNTLYIDDSKIEYDFDVDISKYFAYDIIPYQKYATLETLAKAIIDSQENN